MSTQEFQFRMKLLELFQKRFGPDRSFLDVNQADILHICLEDHEKELNLAEIYQEYLSSIMADQIYIERLMDSVQFELTNASIRDEEHEMV